MEKDQFEAIEQRLAQIESYSKSIAFSSGCMLAIVVVGIIASIIWLISKGGAS